MSAQSFGKYQLLKKIATGGMAEVWLAKQTGIEGFSRNLVVKRILPHLADDPEFVQMFLNEAKIAARFNHPNIAQIYDLGENAGTFFIAMEFIHGEDLGRLMRKAWSTGQWIARGLAIRIVAACCEGLSYAHMKADEQGRPLKVVHRDISPQNILISFDGSVKLVDFGIAKAADQASLTKSGAIKGKFAYMAPEQAAGKPLDHRSDIFAIGLVLYELLTGVRPLKRENEIATLQAALECAIEKPSAVAEVPTELDDVVMRALAKSADDRYRDARQFQMALEEFLVGQRLIASSVQISELMATLFADRLAEEEKARAEGASQEEAQALVAPARSNTSWSQEVEAREPSRTSAPQRSAPPPPEMSWEAPPGEVPQPRTQSRSMAKGNYRTGESQVTGRQPPGPPSDSPSWEAPPSQVIPGPRRRTQTNTQQVGPQDPEPPELQELISQPGRRTGNETAVARTNSRPEMRARSNTGPDLPTGRSVSRGASLSAVEDRDELPPPRERDREREEAPRASYADDRSADDGSQDETRLPPRAVSKAAVRRQSAANVARDEEPMVPRPSGPKKKPTRSTPSSTGSAPPTGEKRRVSKIEPAKPTGLEASPDEDPAVAAYIDLDRIKEKNTQRIKKVLWAAAGMAVLLLLFVFRDGIIRFLTSSAIDKDGIYLKVDANIPVKVYVKHARDEKPPPVEPLQYLGEAPLQKAVGAHLRDTVILENKELGAYYEEEIPFGEPREVRPLTHEFKKGWVKLNLRPTSLANALIFMNGEQRGVYHPNEKIDFYEGKHTLELQTLQLKDTIKIDIEVKPGQTVSVERDLTRAVQEAAKERAQQQ